MANSVDFSSGKIPHQRWLIAHEKAPSSLELMQSQLQAIEALQSDLSLGAHRLRTRIRMQMQMTAMESRIIADGINHSKFSPVPATNYDNTLGSYFSAGTASSVPSHGSADSCSKLPAHWRSVAPGGTTMLFNNSPRSSFCSESFISAHSSHDSVPSGLWLPDSEGSMLMVPEVDLYYSPEALYSSRIDLDVISTLDDFTWPKPTTFDGNATSNSFRFTEANPDFPLISPFGTTRQRPSLRLEIPQSKTATPPLELSMLVRVPPLSPESQGLLYRNFPPEAWISVGEMQYMENAPASGPAAFFRDLPLRRVGWGLLDDSMHPTLGIRRMGRRKMRAIRMSLKRRARGAKGTEFLEAEALMV